MADILGDVRELVLWSSKDMRMSKEIRVPDIGDFKDVPVIQVHVKPGDTVRAQDLLVTLESDKATTYAPAPKRARSPKSSQGRRQSQ